MQDRCSEGRVGASPAAQVDGLDRVFAGGGSRGAAARASGRPQALALAFAACGALALSACATPTARTPDRAAAVAPRGEAPGPSAAAPPPEVHASAAHHEHAPDAAPKADAGAADAREDDRAAADAVAVTPVPATTPAPTATASQPADRAAPGVSAAKPATPPPVAAPVAAAAASGVARAPARAPAATETPAGAVPIGGQLRLQAARGQRVEATDLAEAVVWFVPQGAHVVRPGNYTMNTRQKGFEPPVLAVPVGSRVSFPNGDPVLHNVYSDSRGHAFDLGLYASGESPVHQFRQPGVVDVHCNVHRRMQAKIVVVESHLIARIGPDGRFAIEGVPPGPGRLVAWHPRGERIERLVVAGEARELDLEVPLTRPRADAFAAGARP